MFGSGHEDQTFIAGQLGVLHLLYGPFTCPNAIIITTISQSEDNISSGTDGPIPTQKETDIPSYFAISSSASSFFALDRTHLEPKTNRVQIRTNQVQIRINRSIRNTEFGSEPVASLDPTTIMVNGLSLCSALEIRALYARVTLTHSHSHIHPFTQRHADRCNSGLSVVPRGRPTCGKRNQTYNLPIRR